MSGRGGKRTTPPAHLPARATAKEALTPPAEPDWTTSKVRRLALGVGFVQTVIVAIVVMSSGYFADDYLFFNVNRTGGFRLTQLTGSVYGSLIPGFQLGNSILASFHPIPRWPGIVVPVVLYALVLFVFYRLLELLFGARPLLVVLMSVAGLSSVLATPLVWWTAGLNTLPALILDILAVDGIARHAATGKRRYLVLSAVSFAVGIAFYDGSGSFVAVLVAFTALYLVDHSDWRSFLRGMVSRAWLWVAYVVPIGLSLGWRSAHPNQFNLPPVPRFTDALSFVGIGWGRGFIPLLLGFPMTNVTDPGLQRLVVVIGQLLFWGMVAVTIYRRRVAWKAWVLFACGFLAIEFVVAIGRGGYGDSSAINPTYWTVQPFMLALALALALLPSRVDVATPPPGPARKEAARKQPARKPAARKQPARPTVPVPAAVAVVALCALGIHATWVGPSREQGAQNRVFNDHLAASWTQIQQKATHPFVWDVRTPNYFIPFFLGYDRVATTSGVLINLRIDATQGQGYIPSVTGALVPATADVVSRAVVGSTLATPAVTVGPAAPAQLCISAGASSRTLHVPLGTVVPEGNWFLRLGYTQSSGFTTSIDRSPVRVAPGRGALLVPDNDGIGRSEVSLQVPAGASLCVLRADIEAPVARTT
jgi:hypothetical protein